MPEQDRRLFLTGLLLPPQPAFPCLGQILDCVPSEAHVGGPALDGFLSGFRQKPLHPGIVPQNKPGLGEGRNRGRAAWSPTPMQRGSRLSKPSQFACPTHPCCAERRNRAIALSKESRNPAPRGPSELEGWAFSGPPRSEETLVQLSWVLTHTHVSSVYSRPLNDAGVGMPSKICVGLSTPPKPLYLTRRSPTDHLTS